jgi:hypothetical protein
MSFHDHDNMSVTSIIPATDWWAVYYVKPTNREMRLPLVCWAVTTAEGVDEIAGMVAATFEIVRAVDHPIDIYFEPQHDWPEDWPENERTHYFVRYDFIPSDTRTNIGREEWATVH